MSVIDYRTNNRIDPLRVGPDAFWQQVDDHYAATPEADDAPRTVPTPQLQQRRWRGLAMLALRENAGWPLDRIARAFGHDRGHVSRCLRQVKDDLRATLGCEPSLDPSTQQVPTDDQSTHRRE